MPRVRLGYWLLVLAGLAVGLRLPLLAGSFWLDEAAQALEVVRPWYQQLQIDQDFQPPLYHLLLHLWQYGGHQEWWLRLMSLLPGVGSILIISAMAWRWQGRLAGVVVGVLLATSSLHVFFSQELRPYMLAVFWASVALSAYWSLLWPVPNPSWPQLRPTRALLVFTLANLAGALTSYVYLFFLVALGVSATWTTRSKFWLIVRSLAVTGVLWLAWLPGLLGQLRASAALRAAVPGWEAVVSLSQLKALPLTVAKFWVGVLPIDMVLTDAVVVILPSIFVFYLVWEDWQSGGESAKRQSLVAVSLIATTLLAGWLFSFWTPVLSPKRVLFLLPVLYLIIGQGVRPRPVATLLLFVSLLGLNGYGLSQYWQRPQLQRENWRAAVADLESRYRADNTVVVFGFDSPFAPWVWYQQENLPTVSTGFTPISSTQLAFTALEGVNQYDNVVLFEYLLDLSDPSRYLPQVLQAKGYEEIDVLDYPGLGFIRLYYQQKLFADTLPRESSTRPNELEKRYEP